MPDTPACYIVPQAAGLVPCQPTNTTAACLCLLPAGLTFAPSSAAWVPCLRICAVSACRQGQRQSNSADHMSAHVLTVLGCFQSAQAAPHSAPHSKLPPFGCGRLLPGAAPLLLLPVLRRGLPQAAGAAGAGATCSVHSGGQQAAHGTHAAQHSVLHGPSRRTPDTHTSQPRFPTRKSGGSSPRNKSGQEQGRSREATWKRANASAATVAAAAAFPGSTYPLGRPMDSVAPSSCTWREGRRAGTGQVR